MTTNARPRTVTWPRRAATVAELAAAALAAALLVVAGTGVGAMARIDVTRPLLVVASGFLVGAAARIAKDARQLWATYRNWRGQQLDQICTRRETRRVRRRWTTTAADVPEQRDDH